MEEYDAIIIGGGFYGCRLAVHLKSFLKRVLVVESSPQLLGQASFVNQARVHTGYHYPRSLLTALRSRVNFPSFVEEYNDCIYREFTQYYGVARLLSKVSAQQFKLFCERIGAPIERVTDLNHLINQDLMEGIYQVHEYAFDAAKLRQRLIQQMKDSGVEVRRQTRLGRVKRQNNALSVQLTDQGGLHRQLRAGRVFNCTYSKINQVNASSELPIIPLKHELAEMALIKLPPQLEGLGLTVMCGPFFSFMPFPAEGLTSLSHVRYTPHTEWQDTPGQPYRTPHSADHPPRSAYDKMLADARRYLPALGDSQYVKSIWAIKTVLPASEGDDSRPILFRADHGIDGYSCIMGGKIDNIYDVLKEVDYYYGRS